MSQDNILSISTFGNAMHIKNLSKEFYVFVEETTDKRTTIIQPESEMIFKSLSYPIDITEYSLKLIKRKP